MVGGVGGDRGWCCSELFCPDDVDCEALGAGEDDVMSRASELRELFVGMNLRATQQASFLSRALHPILPLLTSASRVLCVSGQLRNI